MTKPLVLHLDPGHGWLEVPLAPVCQAVVLHGLKISRYSYYCEQKGVAYLEDDSDISRWLEYQNPTGNNRELPKNLVEKLYDDECFIRMKPSFPMIEYSAYWNELNRGPE